MSDNNMYIAVTSNSGNIYFRDNMSTTVDPGGAGTTNMAITSTGNIGIGASNPNELLQLHGSGTLSRMQFTHSGTGSTASDGGLFGFNGNNFYFWNREDGNNYFGTNMSVLTV